MGSNSRKNFCSAGRLTVAIKLFLARAIFKFTKVKIAPNVPPSTPISTVGTNTAMWKSKPWYTYERKSKKKHKQAD